MGVRRALNLALDLANRPEGPVYTYGPLIHNPQVIEMLEEKNVRVRNDLDQSLPANATVAIRTHGVSPDEFEKIRQTAARICNATCPKVARVQSIVKQYTKKGYTILIIGDRGHAEVTAILGYAEGKGVVIEKPADVTNLPPLEKVCIVAQTTQNIEHFKELARLITKRYPQATLFDTICDSTYQRQAEVVALAKEVDAMVVVGGKNSANTTRLAQISQAAGIPTFHIETENDLDLQRMRQFKTVGVTAGASTPNWLIQRVVGRLEELAAGKNFFNQALRFLLKSNIYVAFGAASMSYAACRLQGITPKIEFEFIAGFYIFAIHLLNQFTEETAITYSEPLRIQFYNRYKKLLITLGIVSTFGALSLALKLGIIPFAFILGMSALGILYRVRIIPERLFKRVRYRRLMDIPASKDIFFALAWAVVLVWLHLFTAKGHFTKATLTALIFTFILAFVRSVIISIRDIQGDMIVGRETIPILLGIEKTKILLFSLTGLLGILLLVATVLKWTSPLGYFLLIAVLYVFGYLFLYRKEIIVPGLWAEALVDSSFVLAGAIAYAWYLFT